MTVTRRLLPSWRSVMYAGLYAVIVPWLMRHLRGTRDKCFYRCALKTSAKLRLLFEITSGKLKIFNFLCFEALLFRYSGSFVSGKPGYRGITAICRVFIVGLLHVATAICDDKYLNFSM